VTAKYSGKDSERTPIGKQIGVIVGVALLLVTAVTYGVDAAIATFVNQHGLEPGPAQYVEFGRLYLSTFILSLTVTAAIGIYSVGRVLGKDIEWWVPLVVLFVGSYGTGVWVNPPWATLLHLHGRLFFVGLALIGTRTFVAYYGVTFFSGVITGVAGAMILVALARHLRGRFAVANDDDHELPWLPGTVALALGTLVAGFVLLKAT
jgi:hypothetical protein